MKHFTFEYTGQPQLSSDLNRVASLAEKNGIKNIWIQVYVTDELGDCFQPVIDTIELCLPNARYMVTHAGMAFSYGNLTGASALLVCNLFEDPSTRLELRQYHFCPDNFRNIVDDIIAYVQANSWIRLISFNIGANVEGVRYMNELSERIDPGIVISGGAAATRTMSFPAKLCSSAGPVSTEALVLTFIGGENFHARADVMVGWKGIGKEFTVTRSEGPVLYELDGIPAFELYKKYLKIESQPGMVVANTIEFPLCYVDDENLFLRCPFILNGDNSMVMMFNDLKVGRKVRLSFGSPDVILEVIAAKLEEVAAFEPQVISVNSCLGRYFFWGENIRNELSLFQNVASSGGFLTGGEILRVGNRMFIFNETIVATSMREGNRSRDGSGVRKITSSEKNYSLTQRLATFIDTVTSDLEEYNRTVKHMAVTDALTELYNRREIEHIIENEITAGNMFSLLIIDVDNFKHINDTLGHREGDKILCLLADTLRELIDANHPKIHAGRWGGDEFLVVFSGDNETEAICFAERLQKSFHSQDAYEGFARTISIGVASTKDTDVDFIFQKVDERLYAAKSKGKGCIVS